MPMFDYKCSDCKYAQEHFVRPSSGFEKTCPKCSSANYLRQFSAFKTNIEYSDNHEFTEKVINPSIDETYRQIGKEALDQDTDTLDNIFGTEKVKHTFSESDD
jgi:putative FmdB family regulatory protein